MRGTGDASIHAEVVILLRQFDYFLSLARRPDTLVKHFVDGSGNRRRRGYATSANDLEMAACARDDSPKMQQSSQPSLRQFVRVAYQDWAALMSGALTVPFTTAAIIFSGLARPIFGVMAVVCLIVAMYRVWAIERAHRIDLEECLSPRLRLEFAPREAKFVSRVLTEGGFNMLYVRVLARALSPTVRNCRGFLQRVSQWDGEKYVTIFDEPMQLPWSYENPQSIQPKELNHDIDAFLDVAWFVDPQSAQPPFGFLNFATILPNRFLSIQRSQILPHPERNLKVDLLITGENSANSALSVNIHRGQPQWDRPTIGWMKGNAIERDSSWD
jgi:hypothetical protein